MSDKAKSIIVPIFGMSIFIGILYLLFKEDRAISGVKPKNLLFIGDSLTAGVGIEGQAFVDKLKAKHPEFNIKRIAVTGKQTSWMLDQLKKELSNGAKYDVITIWGGINDIYATNSISGAKNNLQAMYDLSHKAGAKVVALNTIPSGAYKLATPQKIKLTNDLNAWIDINPSKDALLNVSALVGGENGYTKKEYMQEDKLHLTESAQSKIESEISKLL
jgi:lysophospholipase L1-like esterase